MTTSYLQMLRLFSRDLRLYLVAAALAGLAWDGIRAVLLNLYLLRLGYGPEFIGLISATGALSFALMSALAGAAGTRWGSRKMLLAGQGLMMAGFVALPLAPWVADGWQSGWLMTASVCTYTGLALFLVNGLPFMMATTGLRERNYAFSMHSALIPLAAMLGSLVAGVLPRTLTTVLSASLDGPGPYGLPLWLAALVILPGFLALLATQPIEETAPPASPTRAPQRTDSPVPILLILVIAVGTALRFGGRATQNTFLNVYMDDGLGVPTALVGAVVSASQLVAVLAALSTPFLAKKWGNARTVALGTMGMALCLLPLALIPWWPAASFGFVTGAALWSSTVGPMRVFSQELVSPQWRATMAAAFMSGAGLAFAVTAVLGGYVIVGSGYRTLFLLASALSAAGALLFWFYFRVPRGELAREASLEADGAGENKFAPH